MLVAEGGSILGSPHCWKFSRIWKRLPKGRDNPIKKEAMRWQSSSLRLQDSGPGRWDCHTENWRQVMPNRKLDAAALENMSRNWDYKGMESCTFTRLIWGIYTKKEKERKKGKECALFFSTHWILTKFAVPQTTKETRAQEALWPQYHSSPLSEVPFSSRPTSPRLILRKEKYRIQLARACLLTLKPQSGSIFFLRDRLLSGK